MSLSVIQRILCGFSVLLLLLFLIAASGFWGVSKIESRLNIVTGKVADITSTSHELKDDLSLANAAVLQYLLSKSPDSLEGLSQRFQSYKQGYIDVSDVLESQLEKVDIMNDALRNINKEADSFFTYTDMAFSNYKKMLDLQLLVADEKGYLKNSLIFASEDLALLEEGADFATGSSASYIRNSIQNIQTSVVDYFESQNLKGMQALRDSMSATFEGVKEKQALLTDENIDSLIEELETAILSDDGVITKHYESIVLEQESEILAKNLSASMDKINAEVEQLLSETKLMGESAKSEASTAASLSIFIITIVLIVSIVIAVLVALWVSRSIKNPLKEVMDVLGKISNGDFTKRSKVNTQDEFGELSRWVNELVSKLQAVMKDIDLSSNKVANSADSNVRLAGDSKRLMSAQNQRTTEVASSMNEMTTTVEQVAKSSEIILHQIQSVDQGATKSRAQMDANIQKNEHLLAKIEESTLVVNQLDEYSKDIGNILDVIQQIAEQTNLLALNAAIEAARAGEQGRGFAVVADEVRTLATRTQSSTEDIQRVIVQLQQGVTKTVGSMSESHTSANASVEEARLVGASLTELQHNMTEIRDLSTQIATAAEEQSAVAQEIRQNIQDISEMSEQAATGSDQSEKDSEGLSQLASHQKQLLSQFKIV
ncbi:methyl-accepting chemotaxis protein [Marinomonas colpomeniae]|uniref:Methyl-accepting chemotaxis protein n=1 Tax=Marinomonas colpomeniae TaxID=2774408 RepID=A0ABR8NXH7_9GAMM|nr:methyl-accepting chemotaxis protein [Marinomonas colpomeniae]MBD5769893.1 methyl-accepting chemotaxis protein [Marinomonas colpomeniae]